MKLGFRKCGLFENDNPGLFEFAGRIGLEAVQLDDVAAADVPKLKQLVADTGIVLSSVGAMSHEMLGPDMSESAAAQERVRQAISVAAELEVSCISQFAGNDPSKSFEENIQTFKAVFAPLARLAEDSGVSLAFENCPLLNGDPPTVRNLAYCPAAWEAMFEAVPSEAIGLELDTAHLPWLGIDLLRCIRDFADRIRHVHLKDCLLDAEAEFRLGRLVGTPYRYGVPGDGGIDFARVVETLKAAGYGGVLTLDLRPTTVDTVRRGARHMRAILSKR